MIWLLKVLKSYMMNIQKRILIINMLQKDLLGPVDENEILSENPRHAYIVGMLSPQTDLDGDGTMENAQEVDSDMAIEENADYTAGEDDENDQHSH